MPSPAEVIAGMAESLRACPDEQVLDELRALAPLPDEADAAWDDAGTWQRAYRLVALAEAAASRKLRAAVALLYERVSFGDPGEMMRSLRHPVEAIAEPDWTWLAHVCSRAAASERRGTRLWAVDELGLLREADAFEPVRRALMDAESEIREAARLALVMICQAHAGLRPAALQALRDVASRRDAECDEALGACAEIEAL